MLNSIDQNMVANVVTGSNDEVNSKRILGKSDFLKLLVTQLQFQDPTSPMKDHEFIAQLAQFSSLEQLQNMSEGFSGISSGIQGLSDQFINSAQWDYILSQTINNTMAASMIGKGIKALTNEAHLSESGSAVIGFELASAATRIEIEIRDKEGELIRIIEEGGLSEGYSEIEWDGKNHAGERVEEGVYAISIKAYGEEDKAVAADILLKGMVSGVKYIEGNAYLMIGERNIPLADVVQIFQEE